jgi:hypothetical protein
MARGETRAVNQIVILVQGGEVAKECGLVPEKQDKHHKVNQHVHTRPSSPRSLQMRVNNFINSFRHLYSSIMSGEKVTFTKVTCS